jgi:hypothetical protein
MALLVGGCRAGLPPEPPGHDAADVGAPPTKYQPRPNPFTTSAFEGVPLDGPTGHEHMTHGGEHGGMKMPVAEPAASEHSGGHK